MRAAEVKLANDQVPIHPLRLCKEIRDFIDRDAILAVDGQEILNYARQSIPSYSPAHRLNSGPFGTMGVGLPFGIGAKAACPDRQVVVLHGDGSFGLNAMELDTAVRHKLPILVVISLNGGWTGDPKKVKPGRDLGYTRFDLVAQALGCHGEFVEAPGEFAPRSTGPARPWPEARPRWSTWLPTGARAPSRETSVPTRRKGMRGRRCPADRGDDRDRNSGSYRRRSGNAQVHEAGPGFPAAARGHRAAGSRSDRRHAGAGFSRQAHRDLRGFCGGRYFRSHCTRRGGVRSQVHGGSASSR